MAGTARADEAWMERARAYWRERRSTMTAVRRIICQVIVEQTGSFDAEALHEQCRRRDGLISLASVYRTLKHLVDAGLLAETDGIDEKRYYSVVHGSNKGHSTLVCTDCNEVFTLDNPCLALRESEAARKMGFTAQRLSLRVDSSCNELQQTGDCSHRRKDADEAGKKGR